MRIILLAIALASCVQAQDASLKPPIVPEKDSFEAKIIFPIVPVLDEDDIPEEDLVPLPTPRPKPIRTPKFVSDLSEETWLVIESSEKITVTSSPLGHVSIQPEEGPVKVRGKFADGTGKIETRVFSSKYLYFINAIKQGKIEILVFQPKQVVEEEDIPRYTLNVMGVMPNPPPDPKPDPGPKPDPAPEPHSGKLLIEIVEDVMNRTPETAIVMNAMSEWNSLREKGHEWRAYHKETGEPNGIEALKEAESVGLPAMIIRDKETRNILRTIPLPKTIDSVKRILSELGG